MSVRERIIDYSRGNSLCAFWFFYKLQRKMAEKEKRENRQNRQNRKNGILYDIFTFMMSRCAHRGGGYVGPGAVIGRNLSLPHGLHGIFLSRYAQIGENCRIYQNVTIGEVDRKAPVIGDNCLIGAGAVIVGDIKIGSHVKIGAGAAVTVDVPDGCTVVSQPARIIEEKRDRQEGMA